MTFDIICTIIPPNNTIINVASNISYRPLIRKLGKLVHKQNSCHEFWFKKKNYISIIVQVTNINIQTLEEIGDEFHYMLYCPYFRQYRDIYIKKRYTKRPNIINFLGIMAATNRLNLTNLCKFIRIINERVCPPS